MKRKAKRKRQRDTNRKRNGPELNGGHTRATSRNETNVQDTYTQTTREQTILASERTTNGKQSLQNAD
jgi:hypothetical protein